MVDYVYILITTLLFSSMEVAIKYTHGIFHPIQLNFIRFFVGGLILMPLGIKKLRKNNYILNTSDYIKFAILGFVQIVVAMSFYTVSISYIPAYTSAIIFSCNTFFSIVFAYLILKEKIYVSTIIALCFSFLGIFVISNPGKFKGVGVFICITAAILFSLYGVLGKKFSKGLPIGGIVLTAYSFLFGVAELFICIMLSNISVVSNFLISHNLKVLANIPMFSGINSHSILPLAFMCIGVTGIGFASYFIALEKLPVSTVSLVFFIKPVLAPIIAFFILGEVIIFRNAIGLVLISIGSLILFISSLKRK